MAKPGSPGEHILLMGYAYDGNGHLIRDSFLEFRQANQKGVYDSNYNLTKLFNSFGRTATTDVGEWTLITIKPCPLDNAAGAPMALHSNVSLFARGIIFTCKPDCTSTTRPMPMR